MRCVYLMPYRGMDCIAGRVASRTFIHMIKSSRFIKFYYDDVFVISFRK